MFFTTLENNWAIRGKALLTVAVLFAIACCSTANAQQTWAEIGDAPDLPPGQVPSGPSDTGSLDRIEGNLDNLDIDPDLYCIEINGLDLFTATTVSSAAGDLNLWLFDETGRGVAYNGEDGVVSSGYKATLGSAAAPLPVSSGTYYLGISRSGVDALDSLGQRIWAPSQPPFPPPTRTPDGPGQLGSVSSWTFSFLGQATSTSYLIELSGASFHEGDCTPTDFFPGVVLPLEGDFDNDGDVDGVDFLVWQGNFGQTGVGLGGDGDDDSDVDGNDFLIWQNNFGSLPGNGSASSAVPEPSAVILLGMALTGFAVWRRR